MNHFHTAKVVATMGPSIDKETVLAKIINQIDIFNINLSHGDEDTKKKYINMVVKLDSSKTIMLDTKGPEIKTRNKEEMTVEIGDELTIAYAEFFKEEEATLFLDYEQLGEVTPGAILSIDNDTVNIEITANNGETLSGKVITEGSPKELIGKDSNSGITVYLSEPFEDSDNTLNDFTYNQEDQRLHFITGDPENDLPNIIKLLSNSGAHIQRIETNKASLEDVFLNLTGKGINQ